VSARYSTKYDIDLLAVGLGPVFVTPQFNDVQFVAELDIFEALGRTSRSDRDRL